MKLTFNIKQRTEINGELPENKNQIELQNKVLYAIEKILQVYLGRKLTDSEFDELIEYIEFL